VPSRRARPHELLGHSLQQGGKKDPKAKPDGSGLTLISGKRTTFFGSSLGRVASIAIAPSG
jgi:hypothetical protein